MSADEEALKSCCLGAAISAVVAGAIAQFFPNLASNLPAGSIRNLYMKPLNFGLVVGVLVLVISGLTHMGTAQPAAEYNYYSNLLHPETYGYGGMSPSAGSLNNTVQFKNFMA